MKNKLSITQAAEICGFERSYFYKIIKKYNISTEKLHNNISCIEVSELIRAVPTELINHTMLAAYTEQTTAQNNTIYQPTTSNNTANNELIELLKRENEFLKKQLEISQSQVNTLLDTVNRQTLLLEHKPTTATNESTHHNTQEYKPFIDDLRKKAKKKKKSKE